MASTDQETTLVLTITPLGWKGADGRPQHKQLAPRQRQLYADSRSPDSVPELPFTFLGETTVKPFTPCESPVRIVRPHAPGELAGIGLAYPYPAAAPKRPNSQLWCPKIANGSCLSPGVLCRCTHNGHGWGLSGGLTV